MRRRYDDDDAFDENGVLKDGHRIRVPLMMMDSVQQAVAADTTTLVVDAYGGTTHLSCPGPRYLRPAPVHTADAARQVTLAHMRDEAYRDFVEAATNAWRGTDNDREVARVHDSGDPVRDAYLDQLADLTTSWSRNSGRR